MDYRNLITPKMRAVSNLLIYKFVGMDYCISDTQRNLIIEVPRDMCNAVREVLKQRFQDVALLRNAYLMIDDLHDFILVKPLISESPIYEDGGVLVPNLEKMLVDHSSDKEYASFDDLEIQKEFQHAFELYPVNTSRLLRYASRKGKKEEIMNRVRRIDQERIEIVHAIQEFCSQEPVEKAWMFGSFSRIEERADSDIDILVDLDRSTPISLLQFAGMANKLENRLGRKVDLVEASTVKPFAKANINKDKILLYERA